ncbi:ribosome recycling factor [Candidatus Contubernalis alkaliaceticus]|uniref:ribosome recycling factor n=1 Tax=Candidatus Contubernalis alkaliaceticus TaxID=338645 RepID=UPI001F4C2D91|nr:ribosome recycling factor [Candidatus Contubernalis alkalaceticus]UNC91827.1 ribosome recycling factor [Candidatus Contubernalis alkalaceticus]
MSSEVFDTAKHKMGKAVEVFKSDLSTIRAGRATTSLLDKITVDYYGTPTPLNQLANISAPEPRLLVVQPWDKNVMADVEKTILKSDLGLTPSNDGNVIRLPVPQLTEERRKELVKMIRKKAEESKVAIRNIRRDANDQLKSLEKDGEITKDDLKRSQEEVQKLTDEYIEKVDQVLSTKETEMMEV